MTTKSTTSAPASDAGVETTPVAAPNVASVQSSEPVAASETSATKTGIIDGRDLIVGVVDNGVFTPLAYSKTCSIARKADTKQRAHKNLPGGKWNGKSVSTLSETITAEGFACYDTDGFISQKRLLELFDAGEPFEVRYALRDEEATTYRGGNYIMTALDENGPADDDATYNVTLESDGQVKTVVVPAEPPVGG